MTFAQFLKEVKALKLQWKGSLLRCKIGDCPIMALARARGLHDYFHRNSKYPLVAKKLGISELLADEIANAADLPSLVFSGKKKERLTDMRRQMKKALLHQRAPKTRRGNVDKG